MCTTKIWTREEVAKINNEAQNFLRGNLESIKKLNQRITPQETKEQELVERIVRIDNRVLSLEQFRLEEIRRQMETLKPVISSTKPKPKRKK